MNLSPQMKSFIGWIGAACLIIGINTVNNKLKLKFSNLPVDTAPAPTSEADAQRSSALKSLYPLLVKSEGPAMTSKEDLKRVNASFVPKDLSGGKKPSIPDQFPMLRYRVSVDAVTDQGAILNEHFYQVGEALPAFGLLDRHGHWVVPKLYQVKEHQVTLAVGTRRMTLTMHEF